MLCTCTVARLPGLQLNPPWRCMSLRSHVVVFYCSQGLIPSTAASHASHAYPRRGGVAASRGNRSRVAAVTVSRNHCTASQSTDTARTRQARSGYAMVTDGDPVLPTNDPIDRWPHLRHLHVEAGQTWHFSRLPRPRKDPNGPYADARIQGFRIRQGDPCSRQFYPFSLGGRPLAPPGPALL